MCSPENLVLVQGKELVVSVVHLSLLEWLDPRAQNEDNDSKGEQIRCDGLVPHVNHDLRRHVAGRSNFFVPSAEATAVGSAD